ncbi:MAG: diacylglycerol O-acyltransferase / wax synthase [Mycobacterium sp.]|nr:diacylglycerol O-acyltransferase / wax synthase [Mycobacterium sp.]
MPISNVPGPRERGHFAGADVSEIYSVGPLVIADDSTLADPHEATDEWHDLSTKYVLPQGFPGELAIVDSAMPPVTADKAHNQLL